MTRNDFIYEIIISHIKALFSDGVLTKKEFNLINKELIEKYKPNIVEELLDF